MTTRPPRIQPQARPWPELVSSLTPLQRQVVIWLAKHRKEPADAYRAGIVSEPALWKWGIANVRSWVDCYIDANPSAISAAEEARKDLIRLVPDATRLIADTVQGTAGKRATPVSTRLAQWTLDSVFKMADEQRKLEAEARDEDEEDVGADELDGVLRLASAQG